MTNKMIKNKRADITIVILVIGVVAVCFLAIFSFYSSDINLKKDFIGIEMIHEINKSLRNIAKSQNLLK